MPANPATPPADAAAPKGFFGRLKATLNRGGASLARDLKQLVGGRKIDAALMEELETRLLRADVGVEATTSILDSLNRRVARHELDDADALLAALREQLAQLLLPCERPLQVDRAAKARSGASNHVPGWAC